MYYIFFFNKKSSLNAIVFILHFSVNSTEWEKKTRQFSGVGPLLELAAWLHCFQQV